MSSSSSEQHHAPDRQSFADVRSGMNPRQFARLERCARLAETRGRRLAIALVGTPEDADDVIQQAMLVAARKAQEVPLFSLWPWLARVIAFEAKNLRRTKRKHGAGFLGDDGGHSSGTISPGDWGVRAPDPVAPSHEDPLARAIAADLRARLAEALASLDEAQRDALALVYGGGLSVREAAKALGVPKTTLQRSVNSAVETLRSKLGVSHRAAIGVFVGWCSSVSEGAAGGAGALAGACSKSLSGTAVSGTAAATAVLVLGGLVMTTKQIMAVAAVVVLAGAAVWWGVESGGDSIGELDDGASLKTSRDGRSDRLNSSQGLSQVLNPHTQPPTAQKKTPQTPTEVHNQPDTPSDEPKSNADPNTVSLDGEVIEDHIVNRGTSVDVELPSDTPFSVKLVGRVVSVGGQPLPGAVVTVHRSLIQSEFRDEEEQRSGYILRETGPWKIADGGRSTTDAEGKFELTITGMGPAVHVSRNGPHALVKATLEGWQMLTSPQFIWPDDKRDTVMTATIEMTRPAAIRGRAIDAITGAPVGGAVVGALFLSRLYGPENKGNSPYGDVPVPAPRVVTSGPNGAFELKGVGEGIWNVYALQPGISPSKYREMATGLWNIDMGGVRIEVKCGQDMDGVELKVTRAPNVYFRAHPDDLTRVRVTVLGRRESVAAGPPGNPYVAFMSGGNRRVTHLEDGRYMLRGVLKDHTRMVVAAAGKVPVDIDLPTFTGEDIDLGVLRFTDGSTLEILVLDGNGSPAREARVSVNTAADQAWRGGFVDYAIEASKTTGLDGRITARGLMPGEYDVTARLAGHAEGKARVMVQESGASEVTISLERELSIRGRVIPPDGVPPPSVREVEGRGKISNVRLRYLPETMLPRDRAHTSLYHGSRQIDSMPEFSGALAFVMEDWTFEIKGLVAGKYLIGATVQHMSIMAIGEASDRPVDEVVLDLSGVGTVYGVVIGTDGQPVSNAIVLASLPGKAMRPAATGPNHLPIASATTDASGRYRFESLPARDIEFRVGGFLHFHPDWGTDKRMVVEVAKGGSSEFIIDLSAFAGVELRARWRFAGTNTPVFFQMFVDAKDGASQGNHSESTGVVRGEESWFRTSGLSAGRYVLTATSAGGNQLQQSYRTEILIPEGIREHVIDEFMVAGDLSGTISTALQASSPLSVHMDFKRLDSLGAVVSSGWPIHTTVTSGAYRVDSIIAGRYRVTLTAPSHLEVTKDIDIGVGTKVDFELGEPAGAILLHNVKLADGSGNVIPPFKANQVVWGQVFDRAGREIQPRTSDGLGQFQGFGMPGKEATLDGIPVGDVRLILTSNRFQVWEREVRVEAGETVKLDVTLVVAPLLTLRFDPDGLNTADARKTIQATVKWQGPLGVAGWVGGAASGVSQYDGGGTMSGSISKLGTTDPVTFFPIAIGRAGPVEITVTRPGFKDHVAKLTMNAGDVITHDIVWVPIDREGRSTKAVPPADPTPGAMPPATPSAREAAANPSKATATAGR